MSEEEYWDLKSQAAQARRDLEFVDFLNRVGVNDDNTRALEQNAAVALHHADVRTGDLSYA